jgi:hypothetical protein
MPEHLKNAPNSKEFDTYLKNFMKKKVRQHRHKYLKDALSSFALMITA